MSIVKRTVYMVIIVFVALLLALYLISNFIYLRGFNNLEKETVESNTGRVIDALTVKLNALDTFCRDWSSWDDTYYFALDHNQMYVDRNLTDETFISSDISLLLVIDTSGEIVYGKNFDIISEEEVALPDDLLQALSSCGLLQPLYTEADVSGIIVLSGQPALIAARPILTSLDEGPSTGTLVTGRFLDAGVINTLSSTTSLSVALLTMPEESQDPELRTILKASGGPGSVYIQTQEENSIAGYTIVNDLNNNPAFIFKVSMSRDIYSQGLKTVAYLHVSLLVIGVVFCVVFIFMIRKLVLTRLTALSGAVSAIGKKGDVSSRVAISGKDELSRLADNINGMLESLEKSESRRESQKELIGHIITNSPVAVLAFDGSDNIVLFNNALIRMFGLTDMEIFNKKVADIPRLSALVPEINSFKNSGAVSSTGELKYVFDGTGRTAIASFARLHEEEIYILLLTDISEERARQETLYMTDRLASIGEMASGIAHELNNPLTSIIGLSEIVAMENVPDTVKEDMSIIKSESQRAADIVKNLLSFGRKNASLKQPAAVNKIIQDVLRLRSYEHGVNNIKVIQKLDPDLPDIMADPSQIQQVIINLILNAEQAMITAHDKGTLTIKTEKVDSLVKITFTDDGPGIEPENLRHIFDPFFTTKETGKGTGLGLSISYGIVNEHNGRIYASSEPGKGATFVVELPLNDTGKKAK